MPPLRGESGEVRMTPLCIELFAGLFGWGEGFAAEGWRVIGFDLVNRCQEFGRALPPGCDLVLQDVATLAGWQFRRAHMIVASPPCEAYSYRAMPWKRAKALPEPSNTLFNAPFRIQLEASAAAGRYIPLIVENVQGAQPWVGTARWHHGSYYLWGDVPALMPNLRGCRSTGEHVKQAGLPNRLWFDRGAAQFNSDSPERKAATAQLAKIPLGLAEHIARVFKPCA
jgi:hypothetical protein